MISRRTISLLCQKRSGTTAIYRAFRDHPAVAIPHIDQQLPVYEPNFWNLASDAINGEPASFCERLAEACPFLGPCEPQCEEDVFDLWDRIGDHLGSILFDKTPKLLTHQGGLDLLLRYHATGRDVRFLAVVRDPRDVIASQFEHWGHLVENDSPEKRELLWVKGYEYFEQVRKSLKVLLVRYEDLAVDPASYMPRLYEHCGLDDVPAAYAHIRPINIGRHRAVSSPEIASWDPGPAMRRLMALHGYVQAAATASSS